ncbi:CPBP family intramembrane glutamic endopeptidase [Sorangium sp. So ce448]|uniref:CPBP family intramembrane glutamic endopeptidase n=1 Tax=Sorangium sp. So ce448 TaxID=3133314 RepID=UPI003F5FFDDE
MSDLHGTPDPPPSGGGPGPLARQGGEERPMSIPGAIGWTVGVTALFLFLLGLISSFRMEPALDGAGSFRAAPKLDVIGSFACQAAAYLLGLFGVLQVHAPRASIRQFLGLRGTHVAFYPLAIALGFALEGPIAALYTAIEARWPSGIDDAELVRVFVDASAPERAALGLIFIVLGPALEEVFFRGALARPLRWTHRAPLVIAITAALFAVAHVGWQKFLPIGIFGAALGVLRVASGSLLPSILLHGTYNAIQCFSLLSAAGAGAADGAPSAAGAALPDAAASPVWLVAVSSASALVLTALACVLGRRAEGAVRAREKDLS